MKSLGPQLTPEELKAFEMEIEGWLPEDYREFMLMHNGGFPKPEVGYLWKGSVRELSLFMPLMLPEAEFGLRQSLESLRELNSVTTAGILPIARGYEETICLAVRGEVGRVFITEYTYKTVYVSDLVPIDVALVPLAKSFTEFLENLVEIPGPPHCRIADLGKRGTAKELAVFLAEGNSINAVGRDGWTVLCEAVRSDNLPMIRACIDRGANLSGSVKAAVQLRRTHLIEMLVKAGADINERDEFGHTPLDYVVGCKLPGEKGAWNRELRDTLIAFGAIA